MQAGNEFEATLAELQVGCIAIVVAQLPVDKSPQVVATNGVAAGLRGLAILEAEFVRG